MQRMSTAARAGWVSMMGALALFGLASCSPPDETPKIDMLEDLKPSEGFSLYVPPFSVPPGVEVQDCYFFAVPDLNNGRDLWINRFVIAQRTGSHHMNVFRVKTRKGLGGVPGDVVLGGECRDSANWADWPLVVNSQEAAIDKPGVDWTLPEGVAQRFTPGEVLMVQTHYVNADLQITPDGGEVRVNFYRSELENPVEMGTLFATQQSIRVCRDTAPVYDGTCSFPSGTEVHVAAANGHFHSRGTMFEMFAWDGVSTENPPMDDRFYVSEAWDEPPMARDLDISVPEGGGIWWNCHYRWREPAVGCDDVNTRDPDQAGQCCYTFGNTAETAEHCNVFLYYWPKVDNTNIFCN